jgi:hypothetical protein
MPQSKTPESGVNMAMIQMRTALQSSSDESLGMFMHNYALGLVSDLLISEMIMPNSRIEFLVAIAKTYPDDWNKAVAFLKK